MRPAGEPGAWTAEQQQAFLAFLRELDTQTLEAPPSPEYDDRVVRVIFVLAMVGSLTLAFVVALGVRLVIRLLLP